MRAPDNSDNKQIDYKTMVSRQRSQRQRIVSVCAFDSFMCLNACVARRERELTHACSLMSFVMFLHFGVYVASASANCCSCFRWRCCCRCVLWSSILHHRLVIVLVRVLVVVSFR